MQNKIDTETGTLYLNGLVITPAMRCFADYENGAVQGLVEIYRRQNRPERGHITLQKHIKSNGINAKITVFINEEKPSHFRINILPASGEDVLLASKQWLEGMVDGYKSDGTDKIMCLKFPWGDVSALYVPDPHYGQVGGDINIRYNK